MRLVPQLGRTVWVLLGGVLFVHLATFMLLPFFSVILSTEKGLSIGRTGLVIGAGSIAYLAGSLLGGFLSDRIGQKTTMVAGLLIRGAGLFVLIRMHAFWPLFFTNLVSGIGDGLYMPPAKAGIAAYSSEGTKTTAFSYRGIAANIGVTLGPLIGTVLLRGSSAYLFAGVGTVYVLLAVAHLFGLQREAHGEGTDKTKVRTPLRAVLTDRPFLLFCFVTIFTWALFTQLTMSLPLRAQQIQVVRSIGLIWTSTSILVILLQTPITRLIAKRVHPIRSMALGTTIMAIALGSVAFSASFWHLAASAVLFTIGEMFVMPTSDAIVSDLATEDQMGTYFGLSAFVFGAGETLGNIGGGQLMDYAKRADFLALPWMLYAAVGVGVGVAYYALSLWRPLAEPLAPVLEERTESMGFKKKQKS